MSTIVSSDTTAKTQQCGYVYANGQRCSRPTFKNWCAVHPQGLAVPHCKGASPLTGKPCGRNASVDGYCSPCRTTRKLAEAGALKSRAAKQINGKGKLRNTGNHLTSSQTLRVRKKKVVTLRKIDLKEIDFIPADDNFQRLSLYDVKGTPCFSIKQVYDGFILGTPGNCPAWISYRAKAFGLWTDKSVFEFNGDLFVKLDAAFRLFTGKSVAYSLRDTYLALSERIEVLSRRYRDNHPAIVPEPAPEPQLIDNTAEYVDDTPQVAQGDLPVSSEEVQFAEVSPVKNILFEVEVKLSEETKDLFSGLRLQLGAIQTTLNSIHTILGSSDDFQKESQAKAADVSDKLLRNVRAHTDSLATVANVLPAWATGMGSRFTEISGQLRGQDLRQALIVKELEEVNKSLLSLLEELQVDKK